MLALHPELQIKLDEYRKTRDFDAKAFVEEKCQKFNDYMKKCGLSAAVVSVSGGVDSAVTLGMMKYAANMEGSPLKKLLGIAQPIHSSGWALARAEEAGKAIGVEIISVDQSEIHDSLRSTIDKAVGITGKDFATGQLRSYQRAPTGYYVAQLLSQEGFPCVVMGTGNMDEDGYLAYFCKAGDGVVDVQLIADIHKSEVFKVGAVVGVPSSTLDAPPSADLWDGQTDEEELGFSYDFVELFTGGYLTLSEDKQKEFRDSLCEEALAQFNKWATDAAAVHRRNKHKFDSPHNINIFEPFHV